MNIGTALRQARESRMIPINDVEKETKIFRKYLVALENEQFQILPGRVYARGYLMSYARYIGLDTAEILQVFDRIYPPHDPYAPYADSVQTNTPRMNNFKCHYKFKVTTHARLSNARDLEIMRKCRNILAEKKRAPAWLSPFIQLFRYFYYRNNYI